MQEALHLVRDQFGPEATVLHTRELNAGLLGRMLRRREFEIAAARQLAPQIAEQPPTPIAESQSLDYRSRYRADFEQQNQDLADLHTLAEQLRDHSGKCSQRDLPESLFQAYTDLIESDIEVQDAQQLIEQLGESTGIDLDSHLAVRAELTSLLENQLQVSGPIDTPAGQNRVVALVGPTGVGKTTTIAKLAANYRLRENKSVGLITVDTYRIAAVEQLRTYADIMDLPMEVVSTPREMHAAVSRMRDFDLVLIDTAGRSPRDEVKLQELKSMLAEAVPDEVHLVLSAVSGARSLVSTAERFSPVGISAVLVTKLDEATVLGNLLSLIRSCQIPISYLTNGQNVPDDIQVAQVKPLARLILGGQTMSYQLNQPLSRKAMI